MRQVEETANRKEEGINQSLNKITQSEELPDFKAVARVPCT